MNQVKDALNHRFTVRLTQEQNKYLDSQAERKRVGKCEYVRKLLEEDRVRDSWRIQ